MRPLRAIGLMSGTSMDGVDVALVETDGEGVVHLGPFLCRPYSHADRVLLRRALQDARQLTDRTARPGSLAEAERTITERHVAAVESFLTEHGIDRGTIDIMGFHGQTVLHRPDSRLTVQIGDGHELARRLGIPVAFDFRAPDVAAGGHGAPLVPVFHRALAEAAGIELPAVILNLGGVANLTYLAARAADPLAWDTGPGNALLDDLILKRSGVAMDRDGRIAGSGTVDERALRRLLGHPYFELPPPKSLDRNAFSLAIVETLALADAAATLVAFTAETIAQALRQVPARPKRLVAAGGGTKNPILMAEIARRTGLAVEAAESLGWSADAMEAQAFAYLAVRSRAGLPLTFPTTTGVPHPMTGGRFANAA
ncbi:MAG: anhydro-N-acetylmuramic acid kinase [Methylobacteriaceae bacterium]|jgi:anhydro-N-acetylmuramic acid kinase|nr:anhydro-N-acetylmuramic acid kinase [Methylobacteriaceae bacterium]